MSSSLKTIIRRIRLHVRPVEIELEIDEELQFHLDMRERDNLDAGMTPDEARANAQIRFGDYNKIKESCYAAGAGVSLKKPGIGTALPLVMTFLGMALIVWTMGHPYNNLQGLLTILLAVFITFISLISIPGSFKRSPIVESEPILGLTDKGDPIPVNSFHNEDDRSPLERVLDDK